jgi:hypothetical protein
MKAIAIIVLYLMAVDIAGQDRELVYGHFCGEAGIAPTEREPIEKMIASKDTVGIAP